MSRPGSDFFNLCVFKWKRLCKLWVLLNGNKTLDCFKDTGATEESVKMSREWREKWEQRLHTITGVSSHGKDLLKSGQSYAPVYSLGSVLVWQNLTVLRCFAVFWKHAPEDMCKSSRRRTETNLARGKRCKASTPFSGTSHKQLINLMLISHSYLQLAAGAWGVWSALSHAYIITRNSQCIQDQKIVVSAEYLIKDFICYPGLAVLSQLLSSVAGLNKCSGISSSCVLSSNLFTLTHKTISPSFLFSFCWGKKAQVEKFR